MIERHTRGKGHPSYHCYKNHKCRCPGCIAAYREYTHDRALGRQYPLPTEIRRLYREVLGVNLAR